MTSQNGENPAVYEFEGYRLDVAKRLVLGADGNPLPLKAKAFDTLLFLVENPGRVVGRDEIMVAVWPDTVVEENNLTQHISSLRRLFDEKPDDHRFIATVPGHGYRFVADVRQFDRIEETQVINESTTRSVTASRIWLIPFGIVALLIAGAFFYNRSTTRIENPEARSLYLEGNDFAQRLTPQDYQLAIQRFEKAIQIDPEYPWPYIGIATANRVNMLSADAPPTERMPSGRTAAKKAVDLAPDISEAQIALGMITFFFDWEWQDAETQLKRGYDLKPDGEDPNIQLAHFYSNMGRHEEAIGLSTRAQEIDPLSHRSGALHGMILFYAGRYDETIEHLKNKIEFKSDYWLYYLNIQRAYIEKGMYREAIEAGDLAKRHRSDSLELIVQRAYAYARMGELEAAQEALAELVNEQAKGRYVGPYLFAIAHNAVGDKEQALSFLERAHAVRDWRMTFLKVDPRWTNLRSERRFVELMRKMNF